MVSKLRSTRWLAHYLGILATSMYAAGPFFLSGGCEKRMCRESEDVRLFHLLASRRVFLGMKWIANLRFQ